MKAPRRCRSTRNAGRAARREGARRRRCRGSAELPRARFLVELVGSVGAHHAAALPNSGLTSLVLDRNSASDSAQAAVASMLSKLPALRASERALEQWAAASGLRASHLQLLAALGAREGRASTASSARCATCPSLRRSPTTTSAGFVEPLDARLDRARAPRRALRRARAAEGVSDNWRFTPRILELQPARRRVSLRRLHRLGRSPHQPLVRTPRVMPFAASSSNLPARPPARVDLARVARGGRVRNRAGGAAPRWRPPGSRDDAALALVPLVAAPPARRRAGARGELRVHHTGTDCVRQQYRHRDGRVDQEYEQAAPTSAGRDAQQSRRDVEQMRAAEEGAAVGRPKRRGQADGAGRAAGPAAST